MEAIKKIIDDRKINSIIHFTRVENLDSILTNGVVPRSSLSSNSCIFNDDVRADGKLNYSSFSIGFPNHLMFYRLRCSIPNSKWVILVFNSDILINFNCLFYPINAASSDVSRLPVDNFMGGVALEKMFSYSAESRESILRSTDPTDVQAEVMIPSTVTIDYLKGCILNDRNLVEYFSKKFPDIRFVFCAEGSQIFHTRRAFLWGF